MNERDLRIGFEEDGMSEAMIERALDQHEAAALDDAIEESMPTPVHQTVAVRPSLRLALAALALAELKLGSDPRNPPRQFQPLSGYMDGAPKLKLGPRQPGSYRIKYSPNYGEKNPAGSKLARKAARGKL